MRTTKNFLEFCFFRARNTTSNALNVNETLFKDFFIEHPELLVASSQAYKDPNHDIAVDGIKNAILDLYAAINSITDSKLESSLLTSIDSLERQLIKEDYNANEYFLPLEITLAITDGIELGDGTSENLPFDYTISTKDLNNHNSKRKTEILEAGAFTGLHSYLESHGYYMPNLKPLVKDITGSWYECKSLHAGYSYDLLEEGLNAKLVNLAKQNMMLKAVQQQVANHQSKWYKHTTLAKCQDDDVIWPLIENDTSVKEKIADYKAREEARKAEREAKLKREREAAAAKRKEQLEAIERGEVVEPEDTGVNKSAANLIRAINRLGDT